MRTALALSIIAGLLYGSAWGWRRYGIERFIVGLYRHHGPQGILARTWPTGSTVLWVGMMLGGLLLIYYL